MNATDPIWIVEDRCKGCGLCVPACPLHLLNVGKKLNAQGYAVVKFEDGDQGRVRCTRCMACALVCPDCAIRTPA